jgi:hypothetical protein
MPRIGSWVSASVALLACTTVLAGCDLVGSAPTTAAATRTPAATPTPSPELNGGYLSATPTDAEYLDLTETGTAITGSYERTFEGTSPQPPTGQSQNGSVNGSQAGSQLSLTITLPGGSVVSVSGAVASDGTLNLAFPQPDGALQSLTLAPATTAGYNSAEAVVQTNASAEDSVSYWMSQAQTSGACTVAVSNTEASATLVGSDALSMCETAIHAGFVSASTVNSNATTVVCVYSVNSSRVGVTDGGGLAVGTRLCGQLSSMAFPSASPPS